jgi:tRNA (mo5U34)-methyltransferase
MIDLYALPANLPDWPLHLVEQRFNAAYHGDFERWQSAVASLPTLTTTGHAYTDTVSAQLNCDPTTQADIEEALQQLHPWRKGPFQIGSVHIDTEWRSDWKWQRLQPALGDLSNQRVLDIGCGNGYFGWRALAAGAQEGHWR